MEKQDKRVGWLKELKEGDKVFVSNSYRTDVEKIDKITPTGRINVGSTQYNYLGHEITSDSWHWNTLQQWSQEEEDELNKQIRFKKMCDKLSSVKWGNYSYEFIEKMFLILKNNLEAEK